MTGPFQIHADWKSDRATNGLKGYSVVVTVNRFNGVVSKIAVEGFDIKDDQKGEDEKSNYGKSSDDDCNSNDD